MNKEHIQVQGLELVKQGTNSNGPWHLYRVITPEKKYSTFLEGLQIGQEYDVLVENKPFKGQKDGKMHDGWTITGYDNAVYEQKKTLPNAPTPSRPAQVNSGPATGFTEADRKVLLAIYAYLNGAPVEGPKVETYTQEDETKVPF